MAKEKILIVDSDLDALELCLRGLSAEGYIVEGATSGRQAIEMARREQCDLLLMDFTAPDLNGLEVYRAIKEFSPETIRVVITGSKSTGNIIEALQLGLNMCAKS